tara:strand:- start:9725 stop:9973 length:249 start_codon:yes stop_codon:yes gene_type:complete
MAKINAKINMECLDVTFLKKQIEVLKEVTRQQSKIEGYEEVSTARCHNAKIDALVGLKIMCENILEQCGETPTNISLEFFAS